MYPVCRALRGDVPDRASPATPVLRTVSSTQRTQRAVGRHRAGMRHHSAHAATCVGADAGRRRTPVAETTAGPVPRPQPSAAHPAASGYRKSRKGHNEHINRTPAPRRQRAGRHETRHRRGVFGHPDVPRHPVGNVAEHRLLHTDGGILDQCIGRAMADHRLPAVAVGVDSRLAVHGAQVRHEDPVHHGDRDLHRRHGAGSARPVARRCSAPCRPRWSAAC